MLTSLRSPMELTENGVRDLIPMDRGARDGGGESSVGRGAREVGSGGGARGSEGEGEGSGRVVGDREGGVAAVDDMLTRVETVLEDVEVDAVLEDVEAKRRNRDRGGDRRRGGGEG